ncbi:probable inactive receptor kinase RLK902 [Impatiens glandulifera]|uniref:probable inactive receptor kinase RLK902 n=1 Tax=Impatiens glandulifera TaxID=253017 RepID=UPI001FB0C5F4|nr:probable inactive receptor kinase RLK902 [Impatiens glandulifera]
MEIHQFSTLFLLIFLVSTGNSDLSNDRAALISLRSAVGGRSLLWNLSDPTPCKWAGVICSSGRVIELHFPAMGLSGDIPIGTFGNLTGLQTLSLRLNTLSGPIPSDLAAATELRNIYLQGNSFSGPIPGFLFTLINLVHLNLASNNFSGQISSDFNKLTRLGSIRLENNNFTGSIPELDSLSSLILFNVSNNHLTGQVPSKVSSMPASSFAGNSLCGGPLTSCIGKSRKSKLSRGAIAGIIMGSVLSFLILTAIFLLCFCRRKRSERVVSKELPPPTTSSHHAEMEIPMQKSYSNSTTSEFLNKNASTNKRLISFGNYDVTFDLEDLLKASAEVLGKGTFGTTYKAVMDSAPAVVVKRLRDVTVPEIVLREKMAAIGAMDHENLVPLRAYYYSGDEKLLVYDYLPMGSLSALLHGNKGGAGRTPLNWETRAIIALGAARGIAYIHSKNSAFTHGNIKSSNILLTQSYEARISDSGLAQLVESTSSPTRVVGYRAPEVTNPQKISQKADVYSFGVLLLELMTGKSPTHSRDDDDGVDLPRWVQSVVQEEWTSEVFDLELLRYQDVEDEMVRLLQLGVDCVGLNPSNRPSMDEVVCQVADIYGSGRK